MLNPKLDKRDKQAIESEIKTLASIYLPQWNPAIGDAGWAVANAFSKMSEDVINHLNEVPHKLFINYLNRLEFKLNPPLSAKVPIMFTLAKGVKSNKIVPKHAQVADKKETIYEIENSFSVTPASLIMCYSVNPLSDAIYNHSTELKDIKPFSFFKGDSQQEHSLFIGDTNLLNFNKAPSDFTYVQLEVPYIDEKKYQWKYYAGQDKWINFEYESQNNQIVLSKKNSFPSVKKNINGHNCYWIRVKLKSPLPIKKELLNIKYQGASGINALYYNDVPINRDFVLTEKPNKKENLFFYPFGHEPKQNDIFYIASNEAFSKKGLLINVDFTVKQESKIIEKSNISWEYWNGESWKSLKAIPQDYITGKRKDYFPKQITFTCPKDMQQTKVNGEENYWIRAKLLTNSYVKYTIESSGQLKSDFNPPSIGCIVIKVNHNNTSNINYQHLLMYNHLEYQEIDHSFSNDIFTALEENHKTFYLNFNKPFGEGLISLFFEIEKHDTDNKRYLQYYYNSPNNNWEKLTVKDSTNGLTQRGMCEFIAPHDPIISKKFNQSGYWLKIEVIDIESTTESIDIKGIYLNTAWANQYESVNEELLGSSDGRAHQIFQLSRIPAKALILWVKEPLQTDEEPDNWVLWHQIDHLYEASSSARVYILDAVPGEILFGDNVHGLIPPLGRENIKVSYAVGGGKKGNIPKGEIKELVTTIASVDKINNVSDASGGSAQQSIEKLIESAPKRLKTRDRAITLEDYEIITKEASSDVAKVKAFQDTINSISIVIVPFSNKQKPQSAQELIKNVENHINVRKPITTKIKVIDPTYAAINIDVTLVINQWHLLSAIKEKAHDDTVAFLHPVYGGYEQKGWEFGVLPCYSDFFSLFESIKGIDYVEDLKIMVAIGAEQHSLTAYDITELSIDTTTLTCSGIIKITMKGKDDGTNNS